MLRNYARMVLLDTDTRSQIELRRAAKLALHGSSLLGVNPKVEKGRARGYGTYIMHLSPSDISGYNTCPFATDGCRAACLNSAGKSGTFKRESGCNTADWIRDHATNKIQACRIRRTRLFYEDRAAFVALLAYEISLTIARTRRDGLTPVFRLNGTSDIPWEQYPTFGPLGLVYPSIFEAFPLVQFYDYTKNPRREVAHIPNYHLTFSLAESNRLLANEALRAGLSVAVVFRINSRKRIDKVPLPTEYRGVQVVDGDATDLRFLDPPGVYVGLTSKGEAFKDTTGFVKELP